MDLDELPRQARAILDAAAGADDPTAEDRARIDATFAATLRAYGIGLPLAAPSGSVHDAAASGGTTPIKSGATANAAKIVLAIAGLGALAASFWLMSDAPVSRTQAHAGVTEQKAPAGPPAFELHDPPSSEPARPASTIEEPAAQRPSAPSAGGPQLGASPRARFPATRSTAAAPASGVQPASPDDSLPAEMRLIQGANDAVRLGDFETALRLLDRHHARFANGILREERRGLHVLALCGLGQTAAGLRERASFLRDSPRSVLTDKVRAACGPNRSVESGPP